MYGPSGTSAGECGRDLIESRSKPFQERGLRWVFVEQKVVFTGLLSENVLEEDFF